MPRPRPLWLALVSVLLPLAAAAQQSTITGIVTDADHGTPLPAMTAAAYRADGTVFSAKSDSTGRYKIDLPPGTYRVLAYDELGKYATAFTGDAPSFEESQPTTTANGQTVTVNLVLHVGGKITGTVNTSGGVNTGMTVAAYNLSGTRRGFAAADPTTGAYSIVLPPGAYKMVAYDDAGGFAPQFYNTRQTFAAADPVTVQAQQTQANVSFFLQLGARLTGAVTDTNSIPIPNAVVLAYNAAGTQITFAIADGNGAFAMTVPAGTYRFVAVDPSFVYAAGFLKNANSFEMSPSLTLFSGQTRTDLLFRLQRGGNVTGIVTDPSGAPLRNITVAAYNPDGTQRTFVATDANGKYVLLLPPGSFRIVAFDPNLFYAAQFYSQSTSFAHATPVSPSAGQTITLQPIGLSHGGHFSGSITDKQTGAAVAGAVINAYDDAGDVTTTATSGADGTYRLVVPPGSYRLLAYDPQLRYAPAYAGGVVTFNAISPVTVTAGSETPIPFALQRGTIVSGTAIDRAFGPVADVTITALDLNQNPIENAISAADGTFKFALVPGKYKFLAVDPNGRYRPTYIGGSTFDTASTITIDATGAQRLTVTLPPLQKRRSVGPH